MFSNLWWWKQKQIYDITTPAQYGGTCPYEDSYEKEIDCNLRPCPIDCDR